MNARSMLQPAPLPNTLRQGQYGGTFGGPIKKDKTFFFLNYEGQRRGEAPVQVAGVDEQPGVDQCGQSDALRTRSSGKRRGPENRG